MLDIRSARAPRGAWPPVLLALGLGLGLAALTRLSPLAALALTVLACALGLGLSLRRRLPAISLGALGLLLLGYALLGRGFAYLGAAPIYVGELTLGLCLLAVLLAGGLRLVWRSPVLWALALFMALGLAATLPNIPVYGVDALRDAVTWGYALFTPLLAALLLRWGGPRGGGVLAVARCYARFTPLFLLWTPLAVVVMERWGSALPSLPGAPSPVLDLKGGDVAVHLAGVAALLLLALPSLLGVRLDRRLEWALWALWFAAAAIPVFRVRAGLLAITVSVLIVLLFRPGRAWWKPVAVLSLIVSCFLAFNLQFSLGGGGRTTVSAEALLLNVRGIVGSSGEDYRDGTKRWRLSWWTDIVNYTVHGPYFWTGKGYGVNLADADGYQLEGGLLRSPHNGHLTILARSGVPGFLAWVLLQTTFGVSLLLAWRRARRAGSELWARLNVWVLAYWAAMLVNTAFDVYLEGPQGGIWVWSVMGFGVALLEAQRRRFAGVR